MRFIHVRRDTFDSNVHSHWRHFIQVKTPRAAMSNVCASPESNVCVRLVSSLVRQLFVAPDGYRFLRTRRVCGCICVVTPPLQSTRGPKGTVEMRLYILANFRNTYMDM